MTVQVQPTRPKGQLNGLDAIESQLIANPEDTVTAVITYRVAKIVDDKLRDETYPVLKVLSIIPIAPGDGGEGMDRLALIRQAANEEWGQRTGEVPLDFDAIEDYANGPDGPSTPEEETPEEEPEPDETPHEDPLFQAPEMWEDVPEAPEEER